MHKKLLPFIIFFLFSADIFADNRSLDFDGSNDVVNFGDMNEFNSKPEVSVSFWFMRQVDKPNNSNHGVSNILFSHGSDPYNDNIEIGTDGTNVEIYVDCANSDQYASSYNAGIQNNIWYHLAFTYNKDDPDGNEGRLYINGSYAQSWNHWGGNLDQANNSPVSIGDTYHIETPFDGYMDELIIWNIAISPLAINEIYNGHNPLDNNANYNESSSVAGYWNFNEGNGSTLSDLSGNGNNGTIYGATWSEDVPQNEAPNATAQSVTGNEDAAQTITLAGSDADGDALTYALATDPSNGTSTLSGNVVTYTPNENYNGSDSFTFTVSDGQATSSAATVNITVTAVNDAPTASAQSASGNEDETQTIILTGSDADGDALTYTLGTNPSNGTVNQDYSSVLDFDGANDYVNLPDFSYLNDFSFSAWFKIDSRNYWERIFDFGKGGQGDIFLTTMGGRTQGNLELTIHPFGGTYTINPGVTCDDGQWHHVVFTYDKGGTGMVLYIDGQNKGSNSYNTHSFSDFGGGQNFYLGKANWNDPYYDGKMEQVGLYDTALSADAVAEIYGGGNNFNLNTNTGNYNSGANLIGYWKMNEGTGSSAIDHSGNGNNGTINGASWITQGTPDVITYTPNANYNGSDSFTFTSSDGALTSPPATVNISITAVNDIPVIASTPALEALDGSLYDYSVSVNDVDGDAVAITATTKPDWLTISNNNSNYVLSGIPGSSDGGLHDIILSANDGNGGVVTQSYTVAVSLHSLEISESGFRILSSPVSGTIYGDLLEELWTQGAEGSDNANSNPNIWTYGNGWNPVTDFSSDALTAGQGFLMYVFADTDFDGDDDLNDPENPVTISIDGTQQQSATSVVSEPSDWNLIGNPYGLSVDISQMLTDNNSRFNSTVYLLDRTNPGYRTANGIVGDDDEIKPFDGFWIQADTDGNVFEFTEQSIRRGSINSNGRTTTDESSGSAVFTFTNGGYSSSTYLSFTPEGHINLDPADANRLVPLSPAEHLTSMIYESSKSLAINNLPFDLSTDISMDMDVMMLSPTDDGYVTQAEQVDLTWDITNLPEGITLVLRNNITGQNINLTGYPSAIISLPSKGSFLTSGDFMATYPVVGQSQFTLSVYGTLAAAEDDDILPERLTLHSAYPNPFNPNTVISFDLSDADMVSLDIFDIAGRQVASLISEYMIPGSHQINWNPGNLSSGIYLVNLVVGTETLNQKITYIK